MSQCKLSVNQLRRRLLLAGVSATVAACSPGGRILRGDPRASCTEPKGFPVDVPLYQQTYENWSGELLIDDLWTCSPSDTRDLLKVANWAHGAGYQLRAIGSAHNWSPILVTGNTTCSDQIVLVSTRESLTHMAMEPVDGMAVRAETGVLMEDLLAFLEENGYGITNTPAPGAITLGGVLAIDGHGAAIPALDETAKPGSNYGSISNSVIEISAVVWDANQQRYVEKTFQRNDPETAVLATNLGRTFVTRVLLRVTENFHLRCVSITDIPASELFAAPEHAGSNAFSNFLDSYGRAESIWFPFTTNPWFKYWEVAPEKPLRSREVTQPYNYPFSDNYPAPISDLVNEIVTGNPSAVRLMGPAMFAATTAGLAATVSSDIWGLSKNTLLYIQGTTMRAAVNGYGVLTSRANVQAVLNLFYLKHSSMLESYAQRDEYPINLACEIRCSGLDLAGYATPVSSPPTLSALRPDSDHPEWDVVIWFNVLSLTGTPHQNSFYAEMEQWFLETFDGTLAHTRIEWSKGWGYSTEEGPWTNKTFLTDKLPSDYPSSSHHQGLQHAAMTFDRLDPHRIFSNAFLDPLLSSSATSAE